MKKKCYKNSIFFKAISLLVFTTLSITEVFAASNIIYAPTTSTTVSPYNYYDDSSTITPESEVVSFITEDASSINTVTVFSIVEDNGNYYCYENGAMVKNAWRKISKYSYMQYAPVELFPNDYIWAYFQSNGRAIKSSSNTVKRTNINGYPYAFNEYGQMLQGFFNDSGEMWDERSEEDPFYLISDKDNLYHADEYSGILTTGWYKMNGTTSRYENKQSIWLYFNPSNYRSVRSTSSNYRSLKLNNNTYAFDDLGVMLTGFEPAKYNEEHGGSTTNIPYFGSDGAEVKNGFIEVDMSDDINSEIYQDIEDSYEDITIYLSKNGKMYINQIRKIGSYYYGFDNYGVVVKGLSVWKNNEYVATIDTDGTNGKDFIISGTYVDKSGSTHTLSSDESVHYFDKSSGKRLTSTSKLDFSDETYSYAASSSGGYNGTNNKKYYSHGILLKPINGAKYGAYILNSTKTNYTMSELSGNAKVVNSSGTVQSSSSGLKDENDEYWLVNGSTLINIYTVNVKNSGGTYYFKSTNTSGSETWIKFGEKDIYGRTCVANVVPNGTIQSNGAKSSYQTSLGSDSALNFYIK